MKKLFHRWVLSRLWLTFVVLGLSFFAFGVGTLNLAHLLLANAAYISDYGWTAVMEGGLHQLAELVVKSYLSMLAYVVFKTCEHRLSLWLGEPP
ncbi:MAG: hypothetical protein ABIR56_11415 [Polaromonas sp.]